ncbi:MAG: hypothetical protein VKP72_09400 [bacterium]|nr:hypothetical protein [bacterium]
MKTSNLTTDSASPGLPPACGPGGLPACGSHVSWGVFLGAALAFGLQIEVRASEVEQAIAADKAEAFAEKLKGAGAKVQKGELAATEELDDLRNEAAAVGAELAAQAGKKALVSSKPIRTVRQTRVDPVSGKMQFRDVKVVEQAWSETQVSTTAVPVEVPFQSLRRPTLEELKSRYEGSSTRVEDVLFDDEAGVAYVELVHTVK